MDFYTGRLSCDGDGNLYACDDNGDPTVPVYHDIEGGGYAYVEKGGPSHNDLHHQQSATIAATMAALFTADGVQVNETTPHHDGPTADDPHIFGLKFDDDDVAPLVTGHTAAYA